MRVYATIFSNSEMSVQITVSPRATPEQKKSAEDIRLMKKYTSKIGSQSIIFDPIVALAVSSNENRENRVVFNIRYTYQVMRTISNVYEDMLSNTKIYRHVGSREIAIDRALAESRCRKIPTFSHELRVKPSLMSTDVGDMQCLEFSSDMGYIAKLSHLDARLLIESLEHFDATTYSLVLAMADQISTIDAKLDIMKGELDEVRRDVKMLVENSDIDQSMAAPWHPST